MLVDVKSGCFPFDPSVIWCANRHDPKARSRRCSGRFSGIREKSLSRQCQQILPLPQLAFEAQALGDPERYNHAPLDLPAGLSGSLGSQSRACRRSVGAASGFSVTFGHEVCA